MKTSFRIALFPGLIVLVVSLISIPQETCAQRFNHPNFSAGGGNRGSAPAQNFSRPAPAPAAFHPAPPVNRSAPPVINPAPVEYRPTINGGSYNVGRSYISLEQYTCQGYRPVYTTIYYLKECCRYTKM